eukprot:Lithocolla_globosa_v1_NODE_1782_length_2342_cov_137.795365.p3 type:complete len:100 gc:universal NODE_1782_length_2342_cov_137.795365:568-867(+)
MKGTIFMLLSLECMTYLSMAKRYINTTNKVHLVSLLLCTILLGQPLSSAPPRARSLVLIVSLFNVLSCTASLRNEKSTKNFCHQCLCLMVFLPPKSPTW